MPLYEYQCKANGHRFEVRHGMNEDPVAICVECGSEVRRVIQPVGLVFKGSGFYINDSRGTDKSSKPVEAPANSNGSDANGSKTESKPESKSETKSETKTEVKNESKATRSGDSAAS